MKNKFLKMAFAGLVLSVSGLANASLIIFTDRAAFDLATTGSIITNFEENGAGAYTYRGSSYIGSDFSISGTNMFTVDPDFAPDLYDWGTGDVLDFEGSIGIVSIASHITAFGFDFGNPTNRGSATGMITINGFDYSELGKPTFNFFGIVSDSAISPITINFNGGLGIMDNVTVASRLETVPEPSTLAILGLGLMGLAARRFKKQA